VNVPPEIFDEDYLHFYGEMLGAQRSDADAEVIERLLTLAEGMRVLDVPCGHGRIAGRLAARGCDVVGVDSSERFIELARGEFPGVRFELGDMRELVYESEFDAVLNWFTSWGYFDPETNNAVLASFARALRPGGRLLLEMHNPARLARLIELAGGQSANMVERDGNLMVDRVTFDIPARRSRTERFVIRDGRVRKLEFSLEQPFADELVERLLAAGFGRISLYGRDGGPFEPEGPRVLALAER